MGIGYLIAGSVLISEVIGGCANKCRKIARRVSTASINIPNSLSHPNSMKTSKTEDKDQDSLRSGLIFPVSSNNNSAETILRRRRSEQNSGNTIMTKGRGHRRHNSLIVNEPDLVNNSTSISMLSVDGIDENELVDIAFKPIHAEDEIQVHRVEINRVSTPYFHIDENFGEKIDN